MNILFYRRDTEDQSGVLRERQIYGSGKSLRTKRLFYLIVVYDEIEILIQRSCSWNIGPE